jgi:hypothetical protein
MGAGFGPAVARAENTHYKQGTEAFARKDFAAARDAFMAVIEKDRKISADLLFNLGNTHFRLEQPGEAALWYRRALVLDPTDAAAGQNLRLIRRRAGFIEFEPSVVQAFSRLQKPHHWMTALASLSWFAAVCVSAVVFLQPKGRLRAWCWGGFAVALGLAAVAAVGVWGRLDDDRLVRRSVVTGAGVSAFTAPTDTAAVVIDLPAGSEVSRLDEREHWIYASLPGQRVGWVKKDSLARLWPYSPAVIE